MQARDETPPPPVHMMYFVGYCSPRLGGIPCLCNLTIPTLCT
nr:MAG TPA: hypothetical protein [Caudoviricetes sp.]